MKSLYHFLIITLTSCLAIGTEYTGIITATSSKVTLTELKSKKSFTLKYDRPEIENQVKKLKSNDFISFEGSRDLINQTMSVDSVNFVGLKALLGNWSGNDEFCYQFNDFTQLTIFIRDKLICRFHAQNNTKPRVMTYLVNPTSDGWIALISDSSGSYAAEIDMKSPTRVELSLYDSNSGDILRKVILKK